jgi:hypothetical protein
MRADDPRAKAIDAYRRLVQRVLEEGIPRGTEFDACRAVLLRETSGDSITHALCLLLEGALADPDLSIDDTQILVPLLKEIARGTVTPEEVL